MKLWKNPVLYVDHLIVRQIYGPIERLMTTPDSIENPSWHLIISQSTHAIYIRYTVGGKNPT